MTGRPTDDARPYEGVAVAFLTRHGKQHLLRPTLEDALRCRIVHTDAYDTDLLGSFTGEVARAGGALEAARRKASLGMDLLGLDVGLGSEGSFGADPVGGMLPWDHEILVWVDRARGLEVTGMAQGPAMHGRLELHDAAALDEATAALGFPSHALVLRTSGAASPSDAVPMYKGLVDRGALRRAFDDCRAASHDGGVVLETDLRAHCNPTRQRLIAAAARDLVHRLRSICPACASPGFGRGRSEPGLPCADCGAPTRQPIAEWSACLRCGHQARRALDAGRRADPARCDRCNP